MEHNNNESRAADDDVMQSLYYDTLRSASDATNKMDVSVLMTEESGKCRTIILGESNANRIVEFAAEIGMMITNAFYKQHNKILHARTARDGKNNKKVIFHHSANRWRSIYEKYKIHCLGLTVDQITNCSIICVS